VFRRPIHAGAALFAVVLVSSLAVLTGCARKTSAHVPSSVKPAPIGTTETGIASWYGIPYHGRRSANGEIFDMEKLTAAHRTLPFDTWVEVTNLENKKRVDVRITDRGPFVKGRIIDLSQAAAREIDMLTAGVVRVKLKVIKKPTKEPVARMERSVYIGYAPGFQAPTTTLFWLLATSSRPPLLRGAPTLTVLTPSIPRGVLRKLQKDRRVYVRPTHFTYKR
jgi:rare lipoprotein A